MRFTTRVLLLQLATVAAVVALCTVVFVLLGLQQLRAEAEASALNIARTIAADPQVRADVAAASADPGTPAAEALRGGPLQAYAGAVTARTGTLFVVIADDHGIRLAHPDASLLGQRVSTDYLEVLAGNEVVSWERGTLGVSARAKVPVLPPEGGDPVGEVSVGFEPASVFDDLPALLIGVAAAATGALALGALAAVLLRRRFERLTLGLQPEELVALVQNQAAVLDGVGDGVVALDPDGIVQVCNDDAARLLGIPDAVGRRFDDLGLPVAVTAAVADGTAGDGVVVGDRVLFVDAQPVHRAGRHLGSVLIVRDRTDMLALSERLESVRALTGALRVQRHEFANRLHAATGLIDAGRIADARAFLAAQQERGPVDFAVPGIDLVGDPVLQSLVGAKALEAAERGVLLRVGDDTLLVRTVVDVEDVAAVLGNLVDNAVTAAVAAPEPRWVELTLLGDETDLVITVADSGAGLAPDATPFARRGADDRDRLHGLGVGLPLSRDLARRRGGEVWIVDPGGGGSGAVVAATLPGVLDGADTRPPPPTTPPPPPERPSS
ncbi:sensor histidine kinase [Microbacterium telephonicum]|uniref:Sensor-like histidine kinase SenX3 n=1 Tax=Microbacterium telephonicum TaxID=1714841 RepID=A0A498C0N3_9MICO|nr:sensor histidine kinase [Microbacterium telephonicum]RLK48913.1 two-component system CitB family sensor kinase [Microbacterium telephonicum]